MINGVRQPNAPVARPAQREIQRPLPAQAPAAEGFRAHFNRDGFSASRGPDYRSPESIYRSGSPAPTAPSGVGQRTVAQSQVDERRAVLSAGDPAGPNRAALGEVRVQGQAGVQVGPAGVSATAGGRVEANAVNLRAQLVGTDSFTAGVTAHAGASVELSGQVQLDRNSAFVQAAQGGFIGGSLGAQANLRGEVGSVGARGEVLYGLGARVGGHVGVQNGRLRAGLDVGVAAGLGLRIRGSVEIDPAGVARAAGRALSNVPGLGRLMQFVPGLQIRG